jgi:hypothetical protein
MIKKLRYYARFIVVCLLLKKNDVIKKLMDELMTLVDEYTKVFKPSDSAEWNVVLSEISTFLEVYSSAFFSILLLLFQPLLSHIPSTYLYFSQILTRDPP